MEIQEQSTNADRVLEELMKELTKMRSVKEECEEIKREIHETNQICEQMMGKEKKSSEGKGKGELEEQIRKKIELVRQTIREQQQSIRSLQEEGQNLRRELSNLENIENSLETSEHNNKQCGDQGLVIEQVKSELEKSEQSSLLLFKLQNTQQQNSNIQSTIEYLTNGIVQLRKDLDQARFQILFYQRLIKKCNFQRSQISGKNQCQKRDIDWLESLINKQSDKQKEIQEDIWFVREETCDFRSINFQLTKKIDQSEKELLKIESERLLLEYQLKKMKKQNKLVQKVINKRMKREQSEDSDVTVVKSGKKFIRYNKCIN